MKLPSKMPLKHAIKEVSKSQSKKKKKGNILLLHRTHQTDKHWNVELAWGKHSSWKWKPKNPPSSFGLIFSPVLCRSYVPGMSYFFVDFILTFLRCFVLIFVKVHRSVVRCLLSSAVQYSTGLQRPQTRVCCPLILCHPRGYWFFYV